MCKAELWDGTVHDWVPEGYVTIVGGRVSLCDNEEESVGIYKKTPSGLRTVCYDNVPKIYPEFKRCFKEEK